MNFDLSEEQELFTSTVERFVAPIDVEKRHELRRCAGGYDPGRWRALAELGLLGLAVGEAEGGMGGSALDLSLVGEALGKGNAPDPWLENGVLPARLLAAGGVAEALENVLSGERIAALAWAERAQRYNLMPAQTTAAGGKVSGEKVFVMGAGLADHLIVSAREDGLCVFLCLPVDRAGLEIRPYRLADGSIAGEIRLLNVSYSDDDRLDIEPDAFAQIIADIRLFASAELLGLGQRLFDDTLRYVKEREQFGVPIGSFQALQHRLVDCYARLEQSRSMLYRTALADPRTLQEWQSATAGAKAFITHNIDHIAREAVQMHGGMGITDELAIGHAMKRVLVLSRLFGDEAAHLADYAQAA